MFSGLVEAAVGLIFGASGSDETLKPSAENEDARLFYQKRQCLQEAGFCEWIHEYPPAGPVECAYESAPERTFEADCRTMHPATNIAGLWWRPVRDQIDVSGED